MTIQFNKKIFVIAFLMLLLCTSLSIETIVNADIEVPKNIEIPEDVDTTNVLCFLRDIFQINTDKYDATLLEASARPWNDVAYTTGQYDLAYSDYDNNDGDSGSLTVSFGFWNSGLVSCTIYPVPNYGVIHYIQKPGDDLRKTATGVLQRYQTYTQDEQITQMINLLKTADLTNGYTKTNGNLQLSVIVNDAGTSFMWSNTVNGADYSRLILGFRNGELRDFTDNRAFYVLGSTVVNVSEEQAISIALEQATSLSYTFDGEVISGFNIVNKHIQIQPSTISRQSESLLVRYPVWIVDLPLEDIYPGMISFIRVMLWTDTGEVISVQPLGSGFPNGSINNSTLESSTLSDSGLSSDANNLPLVVYLAGICIAIIIPIAIVVIVLKRKSNQK